MVIAQICGLFVIALTLAIAIAELRKTGSIFSPARLRAKQRRGLPGKLPYGALVRPGVIKLSGDRYLTAWEIRAVDGASIGPLGLAEAGRDFSLALRQQRPNLVFNFDEVCEHTTAYKVPAKYSNPVLQLIDESRATLFRKAGTNFVATRWMSVSWAPPRDVMSRLRDASATSRDAAEEIEDRLLDDFTTIISDVEMSFAKVFAMRRLVEYDVDDPKSGLRHARSDLLRFLHRCVTGRDMAMRVPPAGAYLASYIGQAEFVGGHEPRIGRDHVRTVLVKAFPDSTYPAMLERLARLRINHRFDMRVTLLEDETARKKLLNAHADWELAEKRSGGVDPDKSDMVTDTRSAIGRASRGLIRYAEISIAVVLRDPDRDRVNAAAKQIEKILADAGLPAFTPRMAAEHALLGSFPGDTFYNTKRKYAVTSLNVAHIFPFHSVTTGREDVQSPTLPKTTPPTFYALSVPPREVRGVGLYRGHLTYGDLCMGLGVGAPGTGKSTVLAFLALSWLARVPNTGFTGFDKDGSLRVTCEFYGGTFYDLLGDQTIGIAFFEGIDDPDIFREKLGELELMCAMQNVFVTSEHREALVEAMAQMLHFKQRTLSIFLEQLMDPHRVLIPAIRAYTREGGMLGNLLDASEDTLSRDARFEVFELGRVLALSSQFVVPIVTILVNRTMRKVARLRRTSPAGESLLHWLIQIDEAWALLQHPIGQQTVLEIVKTARKKQIGLYLWSQAIKDFTDTDTVREDLLKTCVTRWYFPDATALEAKQFARYEELGAEHIAKRLTELQGKRHVFLQQGDDNVALDFAFDATQLAIIGRTTPDDHARLADYKRRFGARWRAEWLRHEGCDDAANRLEELERIVQPALPRPAQLRTAS